MSPTNFRSNFPPATQPTGERMSATVAGCPIEGTIMDHLRARYSPLRHAEKLLARSAGSTPRTARNWLAGDHVMRVRHLVELMAADPAFEDAVVGLVANRRAGRGGR